MGIISSQTGLEESIIKDFYDCRRFLSRDNWVHSRVFSPAPGYYRSTSQGLVPATSPLKSLHEGAGRRDMSHKQFTWNILRNKSQGPARKFKLVWIPGISLWGTNGQFTLWHLSRQLVAGTRYKNFLSSACQWSRILNPWILIVLLCAIQWSRFSWPQEWGLKFLSNNKHFNLW